MPAFCGAAIPPVRPGCRDFMRNFREMEVCPDNMLPDILIGVIAAYVGGWADEVLMRINDVALAFPQILLALLVLPLSGRACAALLLLATVVHLSLLNQAPTSPYFAHTLQLWEQGRFLRFYGLSQWLGWLWPYAVLVVVLLRLSHREGQTYNPSP